VPLIVVVYIHTCNNFIVYWLEILNQTGVSLERTAGAVCLGGWPTVPLIVVVYIYT
jgi:hypothetical protein